MQNTTVISFAIRLIRTWKLFICVAIAWLTVADKPAQAQSLDEIQQMIKTSQHGKALESINRYLANHPKDAQGRFLKGIVLTGLNRKSEAIAVFQKLTEDYPDLPEPYNNLAVLYAQDKRYDKAREALEKALRTHPAYATAHENLAIIYASLASEAYGKALQLDTSKAVVQNGLTLIGNLAGSSRATATAPTAVAVVSTRPTPLTTTVDTALQANQTPESQPTHPAGPDTSANADITAAVDSWLAAWSSKDVATYFAHYAKEFQPPEGQTRTAWKAERARRVGKPGKIEVGRGKLTIQINGDRAVVRFRQSYRSGSFSATTNKTLVMIRENGKWLIREERVGG